MIKKLEFSRFKEEINLVQYAAHLGYEIDSKKTTKTSIAMRSGNGDKVIISKRGGKWVYFSVYDNKDHGSIIDFIQNRTNKSISDIGDELQAYLNGNIALPHSRNFAPSINEHKADNERIKRIFNQCSIATYNSYLESRGITREVLLSPRFKGRVFQDRYNNAVFPHFKYNAVCGLELRNENTKLFVRGSEKTLWRSNIKKNDDTLTIAEAPIDAISYYIIHKLNSAFYIATCGGFSKNQVNLIKDIFVHQPCIRKVIIITDNNNAGDKLAGKLHFIIKKTRFNGIVERHSPMQRCQDWNDILKTFNILRT